MPHVFISYVHEDEPIVRRVVDIIRKTNIEVWIDKESLSAGSFWKQEIKNAINSGIYFLCFFSAYREKKANSLAHEELLLAVDQLRLRPFSKKWFIPIKIDNCIVPNISIYGSESLLSYQWIEIYTDFNKGVSQLLKVLGVSDSQINKTLYSISNGKNLSKKNNKPSMSFLEFIGQNSIISQNTRMYVVDLYKYCLMLEKKEIKRLKPKVEKEMIIEVRNLLDIYIKSIRNAMEYYSSHFNNIQHTYSINILEALLHIDQTWRYVVWEGLLGGENDDIALEEIIDYIDEISKLISNIKISDIEKI